MLSILRNVRDRLDQIGAEPDPIYTEAKRLWEARPGEQDYAKLTDFEVKELNRYGRKIDLLDLTGGALPCDTSLKINENPAIGDNPNRYKQHGFHFTADNCIGCHACEAACSEKNGNPAHISFRSVGYVEGGTYPDYKRMNISMACNHCDDPVCLKGCPTRAYTKHIEYGAVLQDPDTCFGCGYCTWVCPYNAPQLDPIQGQVSKCNMCVDRLEEGLKPACVSACLGNALNFGVIENLPENREQILPQIPGFPDPAITNPNIRFQQIKSMPNEVTRTDSMPVKYHKGDDGQFRSVVDEKEGQETHWNIERLSSRENPLVIFTLSTQAVMGAFIALFLAPWLGMDSIAGFESSIMFIPMLAVFMVIQAGVLVLSTLHLGKPLRFYRGFNNLKYSPLSREALGVAMFFAGMAGYTALKLVNIWLEWAIVEWLAQAAGAFALVSAVVGLWFMHNIYRIKARPFWNHWQVITSFFGTMFSLGAVLLGVFLLPVYLINGTESAGLVTILGAMAVIGLVAESVGLAAHARYLNTESGEGAAAHYIQNTTFGKTYMARNVALAGCTVLALALALMPLQGIGALALFAILSLVSVVTLLAGRALFYVLVIPTTMPGAFFWKNKGFEEHARDIGLANMPQVGVVPHLH
ncbi:4Fe-4S dicluster domain-containing protein [Ketobacter sp. MCCC 1A13808]|uniref:DmsC/YnfH family molybdoenzyme membrane anchor subunit n=1 Tax=Ketobacter sp. MCCC 1A13808 TaxID=2602738 RepID=UPI000F22635A|nr:DmsC/YnfH family molybdoenzyme membrane anchor subunit [Ketobacter sp. MCCC 1A13808]MVF11357.1 4Fe-4S dicluster domain-containing protein [Ketobacter sp. MCCC 1A13808]RLP54699.1 MAG: 4Fe-4S dicluster domain-containing protein [Ketobacter sp.]